MGRKGNVVETSFGDPMLGFVKLVYVFEDFDFINNRHQQIRSQTINENHAKQGVTG